MIEVKNLVKRYGGVEAVKNVSFTVKDGVICGFLGPNGAGKSTTMNILTGCLAATEGQVTINGHDIYDDPIGAKASVGYLPEIPPLYPDMTPAEYLAFVGEARGLSGDELWRAVDGAIEKTGLGDYANRLIRNLSKGYKQRTGIAQAILTNPEIVILDEPTVGLDPRQILEIRALIRELGKEHTVILSSHILGEIQEVCDEVIIISRGRIAAADTLENLVNRYEGKDVVDLTVRGSEEVVRAVTASIPEITDAVIEAKSEGQVRARLSSDRGVDTRETLFFRFAEKKTPILSMSFEETTLEKVFLELTSDKSEADQSGADVSEAGPDFEEASPDEEQSPEEKIARQALLNAQAGAKSTDPQPKEAGKSDTPAEADASKKNPADSGKSDDYTPLFGG